MLLAGLSHQRCTKPGAERLVLQYLSMPCNGCPAEPFARIVAMYIAKFAPTAGDMMYAASALVLQGASACRFAWLTQRQATPHARCCVALPHVARACST